MGNNLPNSFYQKNICIPIKLYSKHIPYKKHNLRCNYKIFGHYDGISVDQNIYNKSFISYVDLWNYSLNNVDLDYQDRNYSQQILYAIRYDDNGWGKDYDFWFYDDINTPFLFLTILQTEFVKNISEFRINLERIIETKFYQFNPNEAIKVICYSSFETSGFILAIKCSKYILGSEIINSLHFTNTRINYDSLSIPIKYTYTLNGITTKIFNNEKYNLINEKIDQIHLYIIEKKPGSIDQLYKILKEKFENRIERYTIAGNDDECLILKSIYWKEFLPLYEENGLLTEASEIFQDSTYSVSTHFICQKSNNNYFNYGSDASYKKSDFCKEINLCKVIGEHLSEIKKISENHYCTIKNRMAVISRRMTYYKSMSQILNSLKKFEISFFNKENFDDYTFFMLFKPLELFSLGIHFISILENNGYDMEDYLPSKEIFRFLNGVTLIGQNSIHSDRLFIQKPDFNAIVYESPAKLNAFYGAYIKKAQKMLNKNGNTEYEFLIVPGLNEYMLVKDIFDKLIDKKRLFILEIPERQIFDPKNLMPALLHEIAHKVGSCIRARENRDIAFRKILVYMITYNILQFFNINYFFNIERANKIQEIIEGEINKQLYTIRNNKLNIYNKEKDNINKIINKSEKLNKYHFSNLNVYLSSSQKEDFFNSILEAFKNLFKNEQFIDNFWEVYYINNKNNSNRIPYIDFVKILREKLGVYFEVYDYRNLELQSEQNNNQKYSLRREMNDIMFLFSELHADIISIITLELDMDTYIKTIINNDLRLNPNDILQSIMIIRLSLVVIFMSSDKYLKNYNIKKWNIKNLKPNKKAQKRSYLEHVKYTILKVLSSSREPERRYYINKIPQILFTSIAHDIILDYINVCVEKYNKIVIEENNEYRNQLKKMYDSVCNLPNENIDKSLQEIENYILEYKEVIKEELINSFS